MTRLYPLLPWALCVLGAVCCLSACFDENTAAQCRSRCDEAGMVVARWNQFPSCECADPRAPYVPPEVRR